ncbi:MAG: protein kinase [Phycisphaerales bacterium]|nr:protein kinase [Phycisphaerales bacterium]
MDFQTSRDIPSVFNEALRLPASERAAFLDRACAGDADARREVESLVAAAADADGFLSVPALGGGFNVGEVPSPEAGSDAVDGSGSASARRHPREHFGERIRVPGYTLLAEVSRGGQGVVFKAIQASTGRTVALKVLRDGSLAVADARERMAREARVLSVLDHPNIVSVLDFGQTDAGYDFLVMNYVDGRPLDPSFESPATHLESAASGRDRGASSPVTAGGDAGLRSSLKTFAKICDAVGAAHRCGITHRDLSPSNILVDAAGEPHVLDFGLARTAFDRLLDAGGRDVSVTGQFLGKLAYASPEQAAGDVRRIDVRTDVYALGVLLYQVVTGGRLPYDMSGSIGEVLGQIAHAPPTPLGVGRVAPDLEAIVLTALEKDPAGRFQSAGELGRALAAHLAGRSPEPKVRRGDVAARPARRRGWAGAAVAASLVAAAGTLAGVALTKSRSAAVASAPAPVLDDSDRRLTRAELEALKTTKPSNGPWSQLVRLDRALAKSPNDAAAARARATLIASLGRPVELNSIGMRLIKVEPGEFLMGTPPGAGVGWPDGIEKQFRCRLTKGFFLGQTEVTQAQWTAITGRNDSSYKEDDHPVEMVTRAEVDEFLQRLSERERRSYRLPTEAEWEYACRAGTTTTWHNGDDPARIPDIAWVAGGEAFDRRHSLRVASLTPNAWGFFDMAGNVEELTSSWYGPYPAGEAVDWAGPPTGARRMARGGVWPLFSVMTRSAARTGELAWLDGAEPPTWATAWRGFRVVLDPPPAGGAAAPLAGPAIRPTTRAAGATRRAP